MLGAPPSMILFALRGGSSTQDRVEEADARRLLKLSRDHWRVETTCFHVKDDSFGEDWQVLARHRAAAGTAALRSPAQAPLRGTRPLSTDAAPVPARAEWVGALPATIPASLPRL